MVIGRSILFCVWISIVLFLTRKVTGAFSGCPVTQRSCVGGETHRHHSLVHNKAGPFIIPKAPIGYYSFSNFKLAAKSPRETKRKMATESSSSSDNSAEDKPLPSSSVGQSSTSILQTIFNAIGSTTSIVVSGIFFVALTYQRDVLMVSFFVGSIGNAIFGKVMKRVLNQERPQELETADINDKPSDFGMPSSHAMSLGFIGTFVGLTLPWTQVPVILYTTISLVYRVQTKLHTWQQIVVGYVVGSTNGAIWRHLCDGRNPWNINIMDFVTSNLLDENGVLPWPMLAVPALVGFIVVGSVERRISGWIKKIKED